MIKQGQGIKMRETSQKILMAFKNSASHELATSEILALIDQKYSELLAKIETEHDKDKIVGYKREMAQMHRKLLWHLSSLVSKGLLRVNRYGEKGEKFFSLNIADDEEIVAEVPMNIGAISEEAKNGRNNGTGTGKVVGYKRKIVITKPSMPAFPIEGFEQKGILFKFEPATWIDRLNSVIVLSRNFSSLENLYKAVELLFSNINDALCIIDFDKFFSTETIETLGNFVEKVNSDCQDYGKKVSLMMELKSLHKQKLFFDFVDLYEKKRFEHVYLVFNLDSHDIREDAKSLIQRLIVMSSKTKLSFFIKNKEISRAPHFLGRGGPYSIDDKEWRLYLEELKDSRVLACTQSTVLIDINRFIKEYGLVTEKFVELVMNITKALLAANSFQRRRSDEYFKNIMRINYPKTAEFLVIARNYIRLWNYNLSAEEHEKLLTMMSIAKRKIDEFCSAEETIYKSCGMSMRFKVALSCAFKEATPGFSEEAYQKLEIKGFEDFNRREIKKYLKARETLCSILDGGNRVSFYRAGQINPEEVLNEIVFLLNNYKIPFLIYNFKDIRGNLKLSTFF